MNILVTGGLGLIGYRVVRRLLDQGHLVSVSDTRTNYGFIPQCELSYLITERLKHIPEVLQNAYTIDIADTDGINWVMQQHQPDVIIHLASYPRQKAVNVDPQHASRTMSQGLLNLLEASAKHSVKKFVYASSSMVYGDFVHSIREDAVCKPQGQYGIMKLAGEWLVKDYARKGHFNYTIIRPSAVYGEYDVADRVISKFLITAMQGGELQVNGAAETLDFTYADDAADGFVAAAVSDASHNKTYNITKSCSHTLLEAAELAVQLAGAGSINVKDRDTDFPVRSALNIDAAKQDLNFNPQIDIREGIARYHKWLRHSFYWSTKTIPAAKN